MLGCLVDGGSHVTADVNYFCKVKSAKFGKK
jgi:hypothetical protein